VRAAAAGWVRLRAILIIDKLFSAACGRRFFGKSVLVWGQGGVELQTAVAAALAARVGVVLNHIHQNTTYTHQRGAIESTLLLASCFFGLLPLIYIYRCCSQLHPHHKDGSVQLGVQLGVCFAPSAAQHAPCVSAAYSLLHCPH